MYNCQVCDAKLSVLETIILLDKKRNYSLFDDKDYICDMCEQTYITNLYNSIFISSNIPVHINKFYVRCSYSIDNYNEILICIKYQLDDILVSENNFIIDFDKPINEYKFLEIYKKYYNKAKELALFI